MKDILVVEPSGLLYGSEMVLLDIITNSNWEKYSFEIVLPHQSPFSSLLIKNGIKHIELLDISSSRKKLTSYIRLFRYIKKRKPDLIFVNQAGIQKVVSYIANILNIPVVSEVSTLEDGLLVSKFSPHLHKPVKSYICNSDFIANSINIPQNKKSVLYYGYEWKQLNPQIQEKVEPFRIALLGRISESKGHFLIVNAAEDLIKRRPDIEVEVYFIGDAPHPTIEANIRSIIHKANLDNNFVFRGFQTNIEKELSGMNIMVIPSIQEPFGRIFCESAEAKLPCIVANSGGLGELAHRFNLGITFQGKSAQDLSKKIEYTFDNYHHVKQQFQSRAHEVLNRLDKKQYIQKIEFILDNAIKKDEVNIQWYGNENK